MVIRMAWGVHCAYGGAFDPKCLTVRNALLGLARCVLIYR